MFEPRLKRFVEEVFREALSAVDPERLVREAIELRDHAVLIRGIPHRLERESRLVVLALGKAAVPMARGTLSVLGGGFIAAWWSPRATAGILLSWSGVMLSRVVIPSRTHKASELGMHSWKRYEV